MSTARVALRAAGLPLLAVLPALALTILLHPFLGPTPLAFLYLAVLLAAAFGGRAAGWSAILFAVAGALLLHRGAIGGASFDLGPVSVLVSLMVAAAVVELAERGRRRGALDRARDSEIARLQRLYAAHTAINQAIVKCVDVDDLLTKVCRALVELGGFQMAWVGWHDPATLEIRIRARWGDAKGYDDDLRIYSDDRPEGRGPTGTAFREDRSLILNDTQREDPSLPWRKAAALSGFRSTAVFPVHLRGERCATLSVHAGSAGFFQAREVTLLEEAARDLSYALENLEREAERRAAEAALARERQLVDTIIASAPGVIYLYDDTGRFLRWNANFTAVTGYTDAEMATMHPEQFFRGEDLVRVRERIAQVFATGEGSVEAGFVAKDGTVTPYYFTGRRIEFEGRQCLVGMGIDLRERVRAEAAARELERRFEIVAENLREGLVIASPDLELLYWNPAALRLIGFDDPEEGRPLEHEFDRHFELFSRDGEPLPPDRWPLARVRAGETLDGLELRVRRRATGHERILSYSGGRVTYAPGRTLAFVTLQDVTERLAAEAERWRAEIALREAKSDLEMKVEARTSELHSALVQAEAADRVKSAFLATMSHELRTPLNSIIGFTGILLQGLAGPLAPEQEKQLGMVRGSARHLLDLINDVLDISKIEAGQLETRREPVDLRAAVERAVEALRPTAVQKGLQLTATLPAELPELQSDRRRLDQILLNLVNNAVKFTERGSVTVRVESGPAVTLPGGPAIRVLVRDTGIGIRAADLATLFQPFRQLDTGLARTHEGTGLGLAICRRLAELLGGEIRAESIFGGGSTFILALPLRSES
jgi:PAS domain S-box-containing protein